MMKICAKEGQGAYKLSGENLKLVWTYCSTLGYSILLHCAASSWLHCTASAWLHCTASSYMQSKRKLIDEIDSW
jgi:hypothetical protein